MSNMYRRMAVGRFIQVKHPINYNYLRKRLYYKEGELSWILESGCNYIIREDDGRYTYSAYKPDETQCIQEPYAMALGEL